MIIITEEDRVLLPKIIELSIKINSIKKIDNVQRLLLSSFMIIKRALSGRRKFDIDNWCDLLELLSHLSLSELYLLSKNHTHLNSVLNLLENALKLRSWYIWRSVFNHEKQIKTASIIPFVIYLQKKQTRIRTRQMELDERKMEIIHSWRLQCLSMRMNQFKSVQKKRITINRWLEHCKSESHTKELQRILLARKILNLWRMKLFESVKNERLERILKMKISIINIQLFHQWRLRSKLNIFEKRLKTQEKRIYFSEKWLPIAQSKEYNLKTAQLYQKIQITKRSFFLWKQNYLKWHQCHISMNKNKNIKTRKNVLFKWTIKLGNRRLKRDSWLQWTSLYHLNIQANEIANGYHEKKIKINFWKILIFQYSRLGGSLEKLGEFHQISHLSIKSNNWKRWKHKHKTIREAERTTNIWRNHNEKALVFGKWKKYLEFNQTSRWLERTSLKKRFTNIWHKILLQKRQNESIKYEMFMTWKYMCKIRKVQNLFTIRMLKFIPHSRSINMSQIKLLVHSLSLWRKRCNQSRISTMLSKERNDLTRKEGWKTWKLHFYEIQYSKQKTNQNLNDSFERLLRCLTRRRQHRIVLNVRLHEEIQGQNFVYIFRCFKHWERAFQIKKMEEHLCNENLVQQLVSLIIYIF